MSVHEIDILSICGTLSDIVASRRKFYQTPEFNELRKEWYRKVKESGLKDIEYINDWGTISRRFTVDNPFDRYDFQAQVVSLRQVKSGSRANYEYYQAAHTLTLRELHSDSDFYTFMVYAMLAEGIAVDDIVTECDKTKYWVRNKALPQIVEEHNRHLLQYEIDQIDGEVFSC